MAERMVLGGVTCSFRLASRPCRRLGRVHAPGFSAAVRAASAVWEAQAPSREDPGAGSASDNPFARDPSRRQTGRALLNGARSFSERYAVRCYEVGTGREASMVHIANYLQECAANHAVTLWPPTDNGFAVEPAMAAAGLVFVCSKLRVVVHEYPAWNEIIEVETWFAEAGRLAARRDWQVRAVSDGRVLVTATSTWCCFNMKRRRLARFPEETAKVYTTYSPETPRFALDEGAAVAKLACTGDACGCEAQRLFKVRQAHVDMNGHVNNVHYLAWMLEDVPDALSETHALTEVNIEFRSEAHAGDLIEALGDSEVDTRGQGDAGASGNGGNGNGAAAGGNGYRGGPAANHAAAHGDRIVWSHVLRRPPTWEGRQEEEIVRARSVWTPRAEHAQWIRPTPQ